MSISNLKVRKTVCEKYLLKFNDGWDYVSIVIDETGMLQCDGSFGSYGYQWTAFGDCFKTFLTQLNSGYLLGKLSHRTAFEGQSYLEASLKKILTLRQTGKLSKDEARVLWDFYQEEFDPVDSYEAAFVQLYHSDVFQEAGYESVMASEFEPEQSYPKDAIYFVTEVFPAFQQILKKELVVKK